MADLFLTAGLRVSFVVGIDIPKIQKTAGRIVVKGPDKGGKTTQAPLSADGVRFYGRWLSERKALLGTQASAEPALFLSRRGSRLSRQSAYATVKNWAREAGLDPRYVSPHVLRATFATLAASANVALADIQQALGHESIATTNTYIRHLQAMEDHPSTRMGAILRGRAHDVAA